MNNSPGGSFTTFVNEKSLQSKTIEQYISEIPTRFTITKKTALNGAFQGIEYDLNNFIELFDFIQIKYGGPIKLPKGTLIFHSNQYFSEHLNNLEPLNSCMKIQDIRRYQNKTVGSFKYPFSEAARRVFCNLSPAGNMHVVANLSVAESVYMTTQDLTFFQIPYVYPHGHLKDTFGLVSTRIFKEYLEYKNNVEKGVNQYCGFILSTSVDQTTVDDVTTTKISNHNGTFTYPEVVLMDGFDKCTKVLQYDLYNDTAVARYSANIPLLVTETTSTTTDSSGKTVYGVDDSFIPRKSIDEQIAMFASSVQTIPVGTFGVTPLLAYVFKSA